jgi:acetoacetate decarboxylase
MPPVSPLYPEPPYCYKANKVINIVFRTTSEALQQLVPAPLVSNPENIAFVYVGEFNVDSPLKASYREVGIGTPAIYGETFGSYLIYVFLDPTIAIVPSREIWGWPKKNAEITFREENGIFYTSMSRDGVTLLSASVNAIERVEPIPDRPNIPSINLKLIPSVKKNSPPDVMQLTSAVVISEKQELYRGPASLSLASSPADDLGGFPVLEIIGGEQFIENMTLD